MKLLDESPRLQLYFDQALAPAVAEKHKAYTQTMFATERSSGWPRLLVGAIAVVLLVVVALILRTIFAGGDERARPGARGKAALRRLLP